MLESMSMSTTGFAPRQSPDGNQRTRSRLTSLIMLRKAILEKCRTVASAFEEFASELGKTSGSKELTRRQFARFCLKHWSALGITKEVYDQIFSFLDLNGDGIITLKEFQVALELAGPVSSLSELRRKWISMGFPSMRRAFTTMLQHGQTTGTRLTLAEFGAALSKTGIEDAEEHRTIFQLLKNPGEGTTGTVSIDLLAAGMAAVSPFILLEALREKLQKRFGDLAAAFDKIDDRGHLFAMGPVLKSKNKFTTFCMDVCGYTRFESEQMFDIMDFDNSGWLSQAEFISALRMSEADLYLEEVRRKILQRFESIVTVLERSTASIFTRRSNAAAFRALANRKRIANAQRAMAAARPSATGGVASAGSGEEVPTRPATAGSPLAGSDPGQPPVSTTGPALSSTTRRAATADGQSECEELPVSLDKFCKLLKEVGIDQADSQAIFKLIDTDDSGRLSLVEFARGMSMFVPSCTLEVMRLKCLRLHGSICATFSKYSKEFQGEILTMARLKEVLLDRQLCETGGSVFALVGCLEVRQSAGISIEELKVALRACSPAMRSPLDDEVRDAKARQQVRFQMAPFRKSAVELRSMLRKPSIDSGDDVMELQAEALARPSSSNRRVESLGHELMRDSFQRLNGNMQANADLHQYYVTCSDSLMSTTTLLKRPLRRFTNHRQLSKHHKMLGGAASKMGQTFS